MSKIFFLGMAMWLIGAAVWYEIGLMINVWIYLAVAGMLAAAGIILAVAERREKWDIQDK